MRYPICVDGRSRCPPEDCGGAWGYALLRETLADPSDDEHAEMLNWLGLDSAGGQPRPASRHSTRWPNAAAKRSTVDRRASASPASSRATDD